VGDLYDRFSVPIEWRYSRVAAAALFQDVGLRDVITAKDRGWMVAGIKPGNSMGISEHQGDDGLRWSRAEFGEEAGKVREC
jgi:hypothetical protein